jgi:hypothetical protein
VKFKDPKNGSKQRSGSRNLEQTKLFQRLTDRAFWIWDIEEYKGQEEDIKTKGVCCFNHIISLPNKSRVEKSLFDYQKTVRTSLQSYKHISG